MNFKKLNRGTGIIIMVALLLVGTIYLNIKSAGNTDTSDALSSPQPDQAAGSNLDGDSIQTGSTAGTDYFTAFREHRESIRSSEVEYLDAIISDPNTDAETLAEAQSKKLEMVDLMEAEFTIENLIIAKGFKNAAVSFHKGSVNVIIDSQTLTDAQVAQILDIVMSETGESAENIKVGVKQ